MMQGVVNLRREATIPLVVGNASGQRQVIDAVIQGKRKKTIEKLCYVARPAARTVSI
jgi:hypothetical protein